MLVFLPGFVARINLWDQPGEDLDNFVYIYKVAKIVRCQTARKILKDGIDATIALSVVI